MQESLAASCKVTIGYRQELVSHPTSSLQHRRPSKGEQVQHLPSTTKLKLKRVPQPVSTSRTYQPAAQTKRTTPCQIVVAQPCSNPPPCSASKIVTSRTQLSPPIIIKSSDRRQPRSQFLPNCSNLLVSSLPSSPRQSPQRSSQAN